MTEKLKPYYCQKCHDFHERHQMGPMVVIPCPKVDPKKPEVEIDEAPWRREYGCDWAAPGERDRTVFGHFKKGSYPKRKLLDPFEGKMMDLWGLPWAGYEHPVHQAIMDTHMGTEGHMKILSVNREKGEILVKWEPK